VEKSKRGFGLIAFIFLVMALLSFIITLGSNFTMIKTTGTVVENTTKRTSKGIVYYPVVIFQPGSGPEIKFTSDRGSSTRPAIGSKVTVLYKLNEPDKAKVEDLLSIWYVPGILTVVAFSIFLSSLSAKKSSPDYPQPATFSSHYKPEASKDLYKPNQPQIGSKPSTVRLDAVPYSGPSKLDAFEAQMSRQEEPPPLIGEGWGMPTHKTGWEIEESAWPLTNQDKKFNKKDQP
jgi:hypothetical protein